MTKKYLSLILLFSGILYAGGENISNPSLSDEQTASNCASREAYSAHQQARITELESKIFKLSLKRALRELDFEKIEKLIEDTNFKKINFNIFKNLFFGIFSSYSKDSKAFNTSEQLNDIVLIIETLLNKGIVLSNDTNIITSHSMQQNIPDILIILIQRALENNKTQVGLTLGTYLINQKPPSNHPLWQSLLTTAVKTVNLKLLVLLCKNLPTHVYKNLMWSERLSGSSYNVDLIFFMRDAMKKDYKYALSCYKARIIRTRVITRILQATNKMPNELINTIVRENLYNELNDSQKDPEVVENTPQTRQSYCVII